MQKHFWLVTTVVAATLFLATCSPNKVTEPPREKMPVTSANPEALKTYHDARFFTDRLQNEQAAEVFRTALRHDPQFAMAWLRLAMVSTRAENVIAFLDSALLYAPQASRAEQRIIRAFDMGIKGNVEGQAAEYTLLVKEYPGDEEAHLLRGNFYFGLQEYRQAIESYTEAVTINPRMAIAYNQLGYSQRSLGNYGEAEKAFKEYIALNRENPNALDSYAELLLEMGRYPESIEYYEQALTLDSLFVASHIGIACDYGFLGEHEKAREQLALLQSLTDNANVIRRARYAEAVSYVCEGNLEAARAKIQENLDTALEQDNGPNAANDYVVLGNLLLEEGEHEAALQQFNRSIQIVNESGLQSAILRIAQVQHLYNVARSYAVAGDFSRARQAASSFAEAVKERKNPVQIRLANQLFGIIALEEGNYEQALEELGKADLMNPYNLYRIGLVHEKLGNTEMAELMKQRAEELNVLNSMDQAMVLSKTRFKPVS